MRSRRGAYVAAVEAYRSAGFDELYISQIGKDQAGFLRFLGAEIIPRLGATSAGG